MKIFLTSLLLLLFLSCKKNKEEKALFADNPYYDRAWYFLENDQPDSSFVYFNKAKERSLKDGDSVKVAKCLINMAIISGDRGDYFGSQEISLSAIGYLNPKIQAQKEILSSNYNNLGKMGHLLKKYQEADQFYLRAIALTKEESSKAIYFNNIAINLTSQKRYGESLKYFNQLLDSKAIKENRITYSRILSNISKTKWLQNPNYNAVPGLLMALRIREAENDLWGQNASLGQLADYYNDTKPDSALFYTYIKYKIARKLKSADDQLNSLQKLIKLGPAKEAKRYFEIYERLEDSVRTERNAAKNQFALIRYETEKNKAENLSLQRDNAEKKYQISRQKMFLIGALLFIISGVVIGVLWYKKRKQKMELEARNSIRESKLKTSKKVHDVVANGLYRMMSEVENLENLDKDSLLDRIEELYDKSRDISYESDPVAEPDFREKVNKLVMALGSKSTRVSLVGNEEKLWDQIGPKVKYELECVLQELLVNMNKHSGASNVVLKFEQIGKQVNVYYTDDGIGFANELNFKNGLTSTGNRIDAIGGTITFETKTEKGLKVHISFPIT